MSPTRHDDLVTVIVPARNEADGITRCLNSIRAQTYRQLQIVVVDGDSDDGTTDVVDRIAREDARVEVIANPDRIIPAGLNRGLAAARGRWLIRVDAHCTIPQDYVLRAVAHLSSGRYGGVGGRKDGIGRTPSGHAIAVAMSSRFGVGDSVYHYGTAPQLVDHIPFGAYPTALARSIGGWDTALLVNQDYEFDSRIRAAGHSLLFDPALRIDWECRQSLRALAQQYRRYGRCKARVARMKPHTVRLRHVAAPALVAWLLAGAALAVPLPIAGLVALLPYALALMAATALNARRLVGLRQRIALLGAYATMHLCWGVGMWEGLLTGARPAAATLRSLDQSLESSARVK